MVKWATLFFLWVSCVLFVTKAFDITPSVPNAIQYIGQIFLTQSGYQSNTTTISLDGTNGNWSFAGTLSGKLIKGTTWNLSTLCLSGDCKSTWPTGGTVVAGGESIWSTWVNGVFYMWNVGIGTGSASNYTFNVEGSGQIHGNLNAQNVDARGINANRLSLSNNNTNLTLHCTTDDCYNQIVFSTENYGNSFSISSLESDSQNNIQWILNWPIVFWTNNIERMRISSDGNVGIGTNSPSEVLEVNGNIKLSGWNNSLYTNAWYGLNIFSKNYTDFNLDYGLQWGSVSIKWWNGQAWDDAGWNWWNVFIYWWIGGTWWHYDNDYPWSLWNVLLARDWTSIIWKVGIGTATPSAMLTVNGGIKAKTWISNPCWTSDYPPWTMFYNNTINNGLYCFCNEIGEAKQIKNDWVNCY